MLDEETKSDFNRVRKVLMEKYNPPEKCMDEEISIILVVAAKSGKYVVKLEKLALEAEIDTVVKRDILVNGLNKKSTN